jgi:cellulose synthase/poly-beta-1,6-N-acetylglucosamine synthase-like glycosyltransferase
VIIGASASKYNKSTFDQFYEKINTFSYKHKKLVMVDSSEGNHYYRELLKMGILSIKVKPKTKSTIQTQHECYEMIRERFIKSNADHLLLLDENTMPPRDVIERLLLHRKDIVSGCTFVTEENKSRLNIMETEDAINTYHTVELDTKAGYDFIDGKLKQIFNGGFACTLISREVLKKTPFRYEDKKDFPINLYFATDAKMFNFEWFVDTSIICERIKPNF